MKLPGPVVSSVILCSKNQHKGGLDHGFVAKPGFEPENPITDMLRSGKNPSQTLAALEAF